MLFDRQPGQNENINYHLCIFHILQFILGSETWGNKTKEMYYSLLSLKMISFVLFPQTSEPRTMVYSKRNIEDFP